jgi:hypothetical protein
LTAQALVTRYRAASPISDPFETPACHLAALHSVMTGAAARRHLFNHLGELTMTVPTTSNGAPEHREERGPALLAVHRPVQYRDAEQRFSTALQRRLDELLRGERNRIMMLRKYPAQPHRIGVMNTAGVDPSLLRVRIVERLIRDALLFLHADAHGGPCAQIRDDSGDLIETRKYTTKFPHIVIERVDVFDPESHETRHIQWTAMRVQNQRAATRINRMLDAANLGLDVVKLFI